MSGFIEGESLTQTTLFLESLDECIAEDNAVRIIDIFLDDLGLSGLGFRAQLRSRRNTTKSVGY